MAAAEAVLSLARAARSFLLYDAGNEAIRGFLDAMRRSFETYFQAYGDMPLVVRPFELVLTLDGATEVVYHERDREQSLAFRLFRDGVRRVGITEQARWNELVKLLEILSIRYTGIRQQEDDIVTLLWKANFSAIEIEAVEGFVPEEEEEELYQQGASEGLRNFSGGVSADLAADQDRRTAGRMDRVVGAAADLPVPDDFDLPLPRLQDRRTVSYAPLSADAPRLLLAEEDSRAIGQDCLHLVGVLLGSLADRTDPLSFDECLPQFAEIRDFFLAEGQLENLLALLDLLTTVRPRLTAEEDRRMNDLLGRFGDKQALRRVVASVTRDEENPHGRLGGLLKRIPGDYLPTLLELLVELRDSTSRRVLRQLISPFAETRLGTLREYMHTARGPVAADILGALGERSEDLGLGVALEVAHEPDPDLQYACLHLLERNPRHANARSLITALLASTEEEIRRRTILVMAELGRAADFAELLRHGRDRKDSLGRREADALGTALVRLDRRAALDLYSGWIRPKGLLRRIVIMDEGLLWTAASGLVLYDEPAADDLLKSLAERAGQELYAHSMSCRARRRRRMAGREEPGRAEP